MTDEQLQVFWSHFKKLDSERMHFEKPPAKWEPPPFREMKPDELTAYWNGFREIMSCKLLPETDSNADAHTDPTSQDFKPAKRIRGKTPASQLVEIIQPCVSASSSNAKIARKGSMKSTAPGSSNPPAKRRYVPKAKVARDGKRSSVSIWQKVQLFQDTCSMLYIAVSFVVFWWECWNVF